MRKQSAAVFVIAMVPVVAAAQQFLPASGTPVDPNTRFEVVSIKPIDDANTPMRIMMTPAGFESAMPVGTILRQALQKPDYQMVGAPGWINTERYSIRAKPPAGVPITAMPVMLLNLLKDRFQLASHLETREQPIFHLVLARSDGRLGPDLKPSSAECQATLAERQAAAKRGAPPAPFQPPTDPNGPQPCGVGRNSPGLFAFSGRSIAQLVPTLSDLTGRPVIDKTGLTGLYDVTLKFAFEGRMPGVMGPLGVPVAAPPVDPDTPSLSAALQEQLALKLESTRGPVEVVVIDRFEKPTLD
ncbi:MAG: TIGR03435 family protein [Vicinamibacterales bacterium]